MNLTRFVLLCAAPTLSIAIVDVAPVMAQTSRGVYVYSWNIAATSPPPPPCSGSDCPETTAQELVNALATPGVDGLTLVIDWSLIEPRPGVYQWTMPTPAWSAQTTYVRGDAVTDAGQVYLSLTDLNVGNEPSTCVPCARWMAVGASANLLDQWFAAAATAGKRINLAIRSGGGDTGMATPCWMFQTKCGPGYTGSYVGATRLRFDVSAHQGLGQCFEVGIAAPWDNFTDQWDAMLQSLAAHLQSTVAGDVTEYDTLSMVRLTGINRTTDEFRLPEQILVTDAANCPAGSPLNAIDTWWNAQPRYDYGLLQPAWASILASFERYFGDKYLNLPIIPDDLGSGQTSGETQYPFPEIGPGGCIYSPNPVSAADMPAGAAACDAAIPDSNRPLLLTASAAQTFAGQLTLEFESLPSIGTQANPYVVAATDPTNGAYLNATAAFMTNVFLGSDGAACTGALGNPTPCTGNAQYLQLVDNGIYLPTTAAPTYRAQFVEVYAPNVLSFSCAVWQAHVQLTDDTPPVTTATVLGRTGQRGWYRGPVRVAFAATDSSYATNGCDPLPLVTQFSLDNGLTWTEGMTLSLTADGIYTVLFRSYRSEPIAGELEQAQSLTIKIDSTPPVVTASNATIPTPRAQLRLVVSGKITDNLSGVNRQSGRYSVHDSLGHTFVVNATFAIAPDGTYSFTIVLPRPAGVQYRIRVKARDRAGNPGFSVTAT